MEEVLGTLWLLEYTDKKDELPADGSPNVKISCECDGTSTKNRG